MNEFDSMLHRRGVASLHRTAPSTLQVNVGKLCNQACHHCHVDAGPARREIMTGEVAGRVVELLENSRSIRTVDLTGGAPELNPSFPFLVRSARELGREVTVRCNLTVLFAPAMEWLPEFYREWQVGLICSLPCYTAENVEAQRGKGVYTRSIRALRLLNEMGYSRDPKLVLDLVYNPLGAFLPPDQAELEARYRIELMALGIEFNHLFTITNMPIKRFADQLRRWGNEAEYMALLVNHFNPAAVPAVMCRDLVSVGYRGDLYDCDFNQMLEMPLRVGGRALTIRDVKDLDELNQAEIATGRHCFGCTAGAGSSCGGALA